MGLYEVVITASYFEQECINRYNYWGEGSSGDVTGAFALLWAMGYIPWGGTEPTDAPAEGTLAEVIGLSTSTSVVYTSAYAKNIYDPSDFYETPLPIGYAGDDSTGDAMSPAAAYGFRSTRVRTDIRRATKRYVGVNEGRVGAGGVINRLTPPDRYDTWAIRLGANLSYTEGTANMVLQPVVVGREKVEIDAGPPPRYSYRYYEDEGEQYDRLAFGISWQVYPQMRTQRSRQYGVGR